MSEITSLTKENFWNEVYEKFPQATKHFCEWIDRYKKKVEWNNLFNSNSDYQSANGKNAPAPKYHDLPIAMQVGIFLEYIRTEYPSTGVTIDIYTLKWPKFVYNFLEHCHKILEFEKPKREPVFPPAREDKGGRAVWTKHLLEAIGETRFKQLVGEKKIIVLNDVECSLNDTALTEKEKADFARVVELFLDSGLPLQPLAR